MDNSHVPVHTDTRQEPDAAVQIYIEAESRYLAERMSKNPSTPLEVVDHQEWKRKQVENVGNPQVEHKHTDVTQFFPFLGQRLQSPTISQQTDEEHRDVNRRQESARETEADARTGTVIHCLLSRNQLRAANALAEAESQRACFREDFLFHASAFMWQQGDHRKRLQIGETLHVFVPKRNGEPEDDD